MKHRGVKERLRQLEGFLDLVAIVVQKLDIVVDERMPDAVGRRGELGRDAGIHIGLVAIIRTQRLGPE